MKPTKPDQASVVKSRDIPPPKLTGWGVIYILFYIGLPIIGVLLVMDVVLYLFFKYVLGTCYGILCLF